MDAASFDFFYDLGSPYSYLAATQLRRISERTGARSRLYPITLGGVRKVTGHQMPPAQQLAYMGQDTARWAQRYGVAMQMPEKFPISTILPLRATVAAARSGEGERAMKALFHAFWGEGEDISDPAVVERVLGEAGLDGKRLVAMAAMGTAGGMTSWAPPTCFSASFNMAVILSVRVGSSPTLVG